MITNSVTQKWKSQWEIQHIIEVIRILLSKFQLWKIHHIFIEANQTID